MGQSVSSGLPAEKSFKARNSNIELLKIITVIIIIIQHWFQTLTSTDNIYSTVLFNVDDFIATQPLSAFFVSLFQNIGEIGNDVFFICSAWFLIGSGKKYGKKICQMMTDVWLVSVLFLIFALAAGNYQLNRAAFVKSFFPTVFSNNWYITRYIVFLAVYPYLNVMLSALSKGRHLFAIILLFISKLLVNAFIGEYGGVRLGNMMFSDWVELYFIIAYIKKYLSKSSKSLGKNLILLAIGLFIYIFPIATYVYKISCPPVLAKIYYEWINNPFKFTLISIALFNLFRMAEIKSAFINRVSGYSLLIYLIHENLIVRDYYRLGVCRYVCEHLGYGHIVSVILLLALLTFFVSLFAAIAYEKTFGKLTKKLVGLMYPKIERFGRKAVSMLTKFE